MKIKLSQLKQLIKEEIDKNKWIEDPKTYAKINGKEHLSLANKLAKKLQDEYFDMDELESGFGKELNALYKKADKANKTEEWDSVFNEKAYRQMMYNFDLKTLKRIQKYFKIK